VISKIIKFSADEKYLKNKDLYPIPCKLNIPEWFKKLEHTFDNMTVKGCMPFLDSLTTGYILKIPTDLQIKHNIYVDDTRGTELNTLFNPYKNEVNLNIPNVPETHPTKQLGDKCPFVQKNKNLPFQKILNPWVIKTPPGYSCLFIPPMNNQDDRFSIIPAIVDTDMFTNEINFPIIINGDKYPILKSVIQKGTPYVQVIPFKRDTWKYKVEKIKKIEYNSNKASYLMSVFQTYKNKFWNKKSWK
tara:strand:+ start:513 stop:1247 length:735 start_codon:yes stop_codon:yes gene_type:complete